MHRMGHIIDLTDPISPGTVLLTPFHVEEPRVKLTEKNLLTLYRVTFGPLSQIATYYFDWMSILGGWHPNELEARELYRDEERLNMLSYLDNLVRIETTLNPKDVKQLKDVQFGAEVLSR